MVLLSLLGALQGRFGKSSAINPANNPVCVTEKHEQSSKQWSIEIRFQSKRHKRLSGKRSNVSFTANDLLFMASRAPAMVMQARGRTVRAAHSRVTTLSIRSFHRPHWKEVNSALAVEPVHEQNCQPCFPLSCKMQTWSFCLFLSFLLALQAIRQSWKELSISMTTLWKADNQSFLYNDLHNDVS